MHLIVNTRDTNRLYSTSSSRTKYTEYIVITRNNDISMYTAHALQTSFKLQASSSSLQLIVFLICPILQFVFVWWSFVFVWWRDVLWRRFHVSLWGWCLCVCGACLCVPWVSVCQSRTVWRSRRSRWLWRSQLFFLGFWWFFFRLASPLRILHDHASTSSLFLQTSLLLPAQFAASTAVPPLQSVWWFPGSFSIV